MGKALEARGGNPRFVDGKDLSADGPAKTFNMISSLITPELVKDTGAVFLFKIIGML